MYSKEKYANLASDIFIFIIGVILAKAVQFILLPLYTSYMSTEAYGIAELINSFSELLYPIVTLCIYESAFRFAVDPDYSNERIATAVTKVLAISLVFGTIVALAGQFMVGYKYSIYLYLIVYAYSIRNCAAYYVRGCGFSKIFALSGVVNAIALACFNTVFIAVLHIEVEGYLLSVALSYCVSVIYLLIASKLVRNIDFRHYRLKDNIPLIWYAMPLIPHNVLYWVTMISERYILLYLTDASVAGIYVAAIKIGAIINMIQNAVYSASQLNSARNFKDENKEQYYNNVNNGLTAIYFIFGALIICLTPLLANITLKKEFWIAKQFLPIIMMTAILNCISSLVGTMYTTYKQTSKVVPISVIGAISNVALSFLLIPQIGIWGACFASAISYFFQILYKMIDTERSFRLKYQWKIFLSNLILLSIQVFFASSSNIEHIILSIWVAIILFIYNGIIYRKQVVQFISWIISIKDTF